jgi:hypothetical protein
MSHAHPGKVRECARLYTARPISLFPTHDGRNWNKRGKVWIGFGMITFQAAVEVEGLDIGESRVKAIRFDKI